MKRKNVIFTTIGQAAMVAAMLGGTALAEDTVTVDLLHSLTGSMAISEEAVRDAEVLAINEINEAGGVLGLRADSLTNRIGGKQ